MSLLIDSDVVALSDLLILDPELSDVQKAERGLGPIVGAGSITRQAWGECAKEITALFQSFGGDIIAWPGSITTYGAYGISRPRIRGNQIVVSPVYGNIDSDLKTWLVYKSLELFYRVCANRTAKDRYEMKWERYIKEAKQARYRLLENGLPMVAIPLSAPGSLHDYQVGFWSDRNLTYVSSGSAAASTYNVAITWVDQSSGYISPLNKNNAESGPSATLSAVVPVNSVLQINIASLNPPSNINQPNRGIAEGPYITRVATGWNVYAGDPADPNGTMCLQNNAPIPVSTQTYNLIAANFSGPYLQPGQVPDSNYAFQRIRQQG